MKKLYMAKVVKDVIFECDDDCNLKSESERFIKEQEKCYDFPIEILEIKNENQIPNEWGGGVFIWGTDKEITAKEWLKENCSGYGELLV